MRTNTLNPEVLKNKQHFEILDGLRGVAALAVVIFHFMEMAYAPAKNFIAHGFLAVDFFFCLSGFVIAYAYDNRVGKMGLAEFFKSRLIRLHPLVILGSVLGLLAFLYDPFGGQSELYSAGRIILIFICSIFLIPYPVMTERSFNLFGLNAPSWSLFWEYAANIVYALILVRINKSALLVLTILSAAVLCYTCYNAGGSLLGGWDGLSFWDGGARVSYSFLAGMLIFRFNLIIKTKLGFLSLTVLLMLAFLLPFTKWNWLTEPMVVLFYFPLLIALGAGAILKPGLRKLCVFSGKISYPLYMTHYAAIWIFLSYYTSQKPDTGQLTIVIVTGTILLLCIAYLIMVLYDIPLRRYLTNKRKQL